MFKMEVKMQKYQKEAPSPLILKDNIGRGGWGRGQSLLRMFTLVFCP